MEFITNPSDLWLKVVELIKKSINQQIYKTWFEPIKFISFENYVIKLSVPNIFFKEWIEKRYLSFIISNIEYILNKSVDVEFIISNIEEEKEIN
ncbi:MAG: DnaA N-terminal domain-containing protein, partial [bacterium]